MTTAVRQDSSSGRPALVSPLWPCAWIVGRLPPDASVLRSRRSFDWPKLNLAISRYPSLRIAGVEPSTIYPRFAEPRLLEALSDSPVVLVHGPRQCGKTTLSRRLEESRGYQYISFDDPVAAASATEDPMGFVDRLGERTILDEVQRAPALFPALKTVVDRRRNPGRFLLTGSTSVLFVPNLSESLAGRMEILRLHPLAQSEIAQRKPRFLDALFDAEFPTRKLERLGDDLARRVCAGGFPAALARATPRRRAAWYRDYVGTLVQRDLRDLARIRSLDVVPRLLAATAGATARLLNVADLSAPFQVSRPTIRDYVTLLAQVFLLEELPPWHANRLSRLVKTPKLHLGDSGVACSLLGMDVETLTREREVFGPLLETFVFQELRRLASFEEEEIQFHHFRDRDDYEVDIVLERGGRALAGVEVKASATVRPADFRGLRKLAEVAGRRFVAGVVLYDGEVCASFGDRMFAVPIRLLWER